MATGSCVTSPPSSTRVPLSSSFAARSPGFAAPLERLEDPLHRRRHPPAPEHRGLPAPAVPGRRRPNAHPFPSLLREAAQRVTYRDDARLPMPRDRRLKLALTSSAGQGGSDTRSADGWVSTCSIARRPRRGQPVRQASARVRRRAFAGSGFNTYLRHLRTPSKRID